MDDELKSNITSGHHWTRVVYMIISAVFLYFANIAVWVLLIVQFVVSLIRGEPSKTLLTFTQGLSKFIFQSVEFLLYNSEKKPFPFSDWPQSSDDNESDPP